MVRQFTVRGKEADKTDTLGTGYVRLVMLDVKLDMSDLDWNFSIRLMLVSLAVSRRSLPSPHM